MHDRFPLLTYWYKATLTHAASIVKEPAAPRHRQDDTVLTCCLCTYTIFFCVYTTFVTMLSAPTRAWVLLLLLQVFKSPQLRSRAPLLLTRQYPSRYAVPTCNPNPILLAPSRPAQLSRTDTKAILWACNGPQQSIHEPDD